METSLHRVFVGGLFESITEDELRNRFQTFGNVTDVTIVHKKDGEGNSSNTFGYINLVTTTQKLNKCFAVYGGTKWKGCELKVQLAKEDFMARLQRERNEPVVKKKKKKGNSGPSKTYTDILETTSTMKKIVPGTPVEGERNWVIGKYGRPLPIVHIPNTKAGGKKTVKVDPSKFCHCLKRIPDDIMDDRVNLDKLTWTYNDNEINLIHKKKKKKKKESKENNMDWDSIETHIIDNNCNAGTGDSIGYTEEIAGTNEEIEMQTLEKHKKKKRKQEMKENIPTLPFPVYADNALPKSIGGGNVTKKIKHKQLDDVVVQTNIDDFSADNPNVEPVNKPEKKKKLEKPVHTISTPVDPVLVIGRRKRKCKDKNMELSKQEYRDQSNNEVGLQSILVENEKQCDKILLEIIEQDGKVNDSELLTCDIEKKKPKYSGSEHRKCKEICIPGILFVDVPDDSIGNSKSKENLLSTSIVKQLLSGSKKHTPAISRNYLSDDLLSTNGSQMAQNDKDENFEDSAEIENLFDFKFEDIGGKNNSFNRLFNTIEVRDDVDEIHESSGESEEDSTSSNESSSDPVNTKEPAMDTQFNNNDSMVENIGHIITNSNEISEDTKEHKNIEQVNTDQIKISKSNACIDGGYQINNSKNDDVGSDKQIKKSKILNFNKQEKHAISEEKRKKSLEARNSEISQNKGLISKVLKDVDRLATTNCVTFSESDGDEEEPLKTAREVGTGEKGLSSDNADGDFSSVKTRKTQTKLFDDDTDDEQTTDNEEIIIKSQFQGKEGEKLFRMQQMFAGDSRFKLDERFAGDASEEENVDEKDVENDATHDDDLQKEKEMNISVLEEVLGKSISNVRKERDYTYQRYDPDSTGHEKFEVIAKLCDKNATDDDEIEIRKVKAPTVQKFPEVSKDSFYTVDTSIKDLFGKGESASFSFLGNGNVTPKDDAIQNASQNTGNENQSKEVTDKQMESDSDEKMSTCSTKRLDDMLRSDQTSEGNVNSIENKDKVDTKMHTYLYIPDGDDRLDIGKRFIRTEGLEEITNQWKAIRKTLTEDYKKKHKDAVRYVRKIREQRFSRHHV